jgi:hypothetical protein
MRLFIVVNGKDVAAFEADAAPRVGESVWFKTRDEQGTYVVEDVEHQFDRTKAETYSSHDVTLYCRLK